VSTPRGGTPSILDEEARSSTRSRRNRASPHDNRDVHGPRPTRPVARRLDSQGFCGCPRGRTARPEERRLRANSARVVMAPGSSFPRSWIANPSQSYSSGQGQDRRLRHQTGRVKRPEPAPSIPPRAHRTLTRWPASSICPFTSPFGPQTPISRNPPSARCLLCRGRRRLSQKGAGREDKNPKVDHDSGPQLRRTDRTSGPPNMSLTEAAHRRCRARIADQKFSTPHPIRSARSFMGVVPASPNFRHLRPAPGNTSFDGLHPLTGKVLWTEVVGR